MPAFPDGRVLDLLESVKRRPALYNFDVSRRASESKLRLQLWDEVSAELGLAADQCKIKWLRLRSELRKKNSHDSKDEQYKFKYLEEMRYFIPLMAQFPRSKPKDSPKAVRGSQKRPSPAQPKAVKQMRLSLASGLQSYSQKHTPISALRMKRKSLPASTITRPDQTEIIDSKSTQSPARHSTLRLDDTSINHGESSAHIQEFKSPSIITQRMEDNSITQCATQEKTTLEDYSEFHFITSMLETMEDIPMNKRSMVKAKIMAQIAAMYE